MKTYFLENKQTSRDHLLYGAMLGDSKFTINIYKTFRAPNLVLKHCKSFISCTNILGISYKSSKYIIAMCKSKIAKY